MITPDQIRAARALKDWSQSDLAQQSGLAVPTIANIELGKQKPSPSTIDKIRLAFEIEDIAFLGNIGVEKIEKEVKVYKGNSELYSFYEEIWNTLKEKDDEVLVGNANEQDFVRHLDPDLLKTHIRNINKIQEKRNIRYKVLLCEGDYFFAGNYPTQKSHAEYRWTRKDEFQTIPFYVFGNKMAIILWLDEPIIFRIHSKEATDIYREKFHTMWDNSIVPDKFYDLSELELDDEIRKKMDWSL